MESEEAAVSAIEGPKLIILLQTEFVGMNMQMTKLAIIPFTVLLETLFLNKKFSKNIKLSLLVLLLGVGIASITDLKLNLLGSVLSLLAIATTCVGQIIVSDDGEKVRRKQLFTERDKGELQSRTVIVENLPEDYTRQSLEKMFNTVRSVKNVLICNPQDPNTARSLKSDVLITNKLNALVEFETADQAGKAFRALSDQFYRSPEHHKFVRQQVINQLKSNPEIYEGYVPMAYGDYLKKMSK
ncbi:hypothetical protein J5N97_003797 [Dioscorea zingiberensis]|uniref:RRM domain-containing protein n=1 Tax=Dioscorea zingiberensis TaxID=325984 RepID=A0A9D5HQX9_9LILI|nr:hypothetical protein J5N97_003797 [Dioscorea zingiberensis]